MTFALNINEHSDSGRSGDPYRGTWVTPKFPDIYSLSQIPGKIIRGYGTSASLSGLLYTAVLMH